MLLIVLLMVGIVGYSVYLIGVFNVLLFEMLVFVEVSMSGNLLMVIVNVVMKNIGFVFSDNGVILVVVVLVVIIGLCINVLGDKICVFKKLIEEVNVMVMLFLIFVIIKFVFIVVFMLLVWMFVFYGIDYLKLVLVYVVIMIVMFLVFLMIGYLLFILFVIKLNFVFFIKKIMKVVVFGFFIFFLVVILLLNIKIMVEELGVDSDVVVFVLLLGMIINMNGIVIM